MRARLLALTSSLFSSEANNRLALLKSVLLRKSRVSIEAVTKKGADVNIIFRSFGNFEVQIQGFT